jgi:plastocyanin
MSLGWKRMLSGGLLAMALTGAACSNYGGTNGLVGSSAAPGSSAAATSAGAKTSAPQSTSAPASSSATVSCDKNSGGTFSVTQQNFNFQPAKFSAKSCTTVKITNKDSFEHTFTIPNTTINVTLNGGSSSTAQLALPPGTYVYYCRFHGSPDGTGMAGKLTVT